jgi:hypothetical protein
MHSCVQKWNGVILPDRAAFPTCFAPQIDAARQNYRIKIIGLKLFD